jgi:membrane fusion protein, multidrug efflux system
VKKGILSAAAAIIIFVGCVVAWHLVAARNSTDRQDFTPPPIPVTPGEVTVESVPVFVSGLGTVQAYMNVAVKTRVDGQITGVAFTEGQDVKTGDLLFQIDPRPFLPVAALPTVDFPTITVTAQLPGASPDTMLR